MTENGSRPTGTAVNNNNVVTIDLGEVFSVLWHRIWLLILVAAICAAAGYGVSRFLLPPEYESTTQIYVLNKSDVDRGEVTTNDLQAGTQLTKDYASIITSRYVLEKVISKLHLDYSYEQMQKHVSVTTPTDTRIVSITVTDYDPAMAQKIADEIRTEASQHIKNVMDIDAVNVVEEANLPTKKSAPNNTRNAVVCALIGLLVVSAILIIQYITDDTIKTQEDVQKYLGLSTLALIPLDDEILRNSIESTEKRGRRKKKAGAGSRGNSGTSSRAGSRANNPAARGSEDGRSNVEMYSAGAGVNEAGDFLHGEENRNPGINGDSARSDLHQAKGRGSDHGAAIDGSAEDGQRGQNGSVRPESENFDHVRHGQDGLGRSGRENSDPVQAAGERGTEQSNHSPEDIIDDIPDVTEDIVVSGISKKRVSRQVVSGRRNRSLRDREPGRGDHIEEPKEVNIDELK